ncbi:tyrosine-type recombinase/integrase [Paracoccus sp. (in: a-proteobacteria)]|uniref:tyrosine-type recombinase/integrase n=1 Tax=Paracoccus sp. TaxID=267 RepID=UPI002AFF9F76|nr:tyrosine-type recombinase/integrase [Paracoccus sp. (in: a-proteobacteria)]
MLTKLKHLNPSGKFPSGNTRYYYRPKGRKGVAMPDLPADHPEFLAAYAKAAGVTPRAIVTRGTLGAALTLYKASDDFALLAATTRAQRRPIIDDLIERYGHASHEGLARKHIDKDLDRFTGSVRNNHLKTWRGFCAWMVDHYKLPNNPSDGIKKSKVAKSDGHIPWDEDQIAKFREYWAVGTMERLAFELIYWTGARVSDAIRLGPRNIDKDGWLFFSQGKTGRDAVIPFNRELPEFAEPMAGDLSLLHASISARTERHITYLHTRQGASRSSKSISQWFAAKARKAGIDARTAHGLRKSRAEALFENGATMAQAQAWIGHKDPWMLQHYADKYDMRRALSRTDGEQKVPTSDIKFQKGGK